MTAAGSVWSRLGQSGCQQTPVRDTYLMVSPLLAGAHYQEVEGFSLLNLKCSSCSMLLYVLELETFQVKYSHSSDCKALVILISIQFSFIYIAPNYNNCHLKALK